ncbi:hypothetical protein E2C01_042497 [Portunus trituberculatus]|uniref:Uncharacterized protein n=1 Tax=Portunus trituberculatus TaxID=210409 RepID=A0A5B7FTT4_PORTR|nr:hypothetical protein [Portunus trituberculatus]
MEEVSVRDGAGDDEEMDGWKKLEDVYPLLTKTSQNSGVMNHVFLKPQTTPATKYITQGLDLQHKALIINTPPANTAHRPQYHVYFKQRNT